MAKTKLPVELRKLGDNIRRIRTSLKMSQERLAELADINSRTVRRIEAGEINTLITTIARIRKALGCKWDDLAPAEWKR
ncbi:MAG TPA: helix-turn-helix transcriptional regulator [Verrucomicrobiae bacterium]|nr:helix-turn-helix transcriptional regulator [Verrucomicrobiae bacterium]